MLFAIFLTGIIVVVYKHSYFLPVCVPVLDIRIDLTGKRYKCLYTACTRIGTTYKVVRKQTCFILYKKHYYIIIMRSIDLGEKFIEITIFLQSWMLFENVTVTVTNLCSPRQSMGLLLTMEGFGPYTCIA